MKLLTEQHDYSDIQGLKLLLESRGIPVYIANEDSARTFGYLYPMGKYALHVVFDEQYDDALMLMQDNEYIVKNPVDVAAYYEHLAQTESQVSKSVYNGFITAAILLAASILILLLLVSN